MIWYKQLRVKIALDLVHKKDSVMHELDKICKVEWQYQASKKWTRKLVFYRYDSRDAIVK